MKNRGAAFFIQSPSEDVGFNEWWGQAPMWSKSINLRKMS